MPRTRKQTIDVAAEVKVPAVLITRQQYIEDIKVRWQIHQYEVNKLVEDVKNLVKVVNPHVKKAVQFVDQKYQQLRSRSVTV